MARKRTLTTPPVRSPFLLVNTSHHYESLIQTEIIDAGVKRGSRGLRRRHSVNHQINPRPQRPVNHHNINIHES